MSVPLLTRLVTKPATGLPPKAHRPGTWRPGTADDVRRAVTTSALHAATLAYFIRPDADTWDALIAAQVTADTTR